MRSLYLIAILLGTAACAEETPIGTHESALSVPAGLEVAAMALSPKD
jgi:hypothetical protein